MLEALGITVSFGNGHGGRFKALDNVSVSLPEGKIVGIVGESGSGKTTLIRTIAGLQKPDSGTIRHSGGGEKARIAMVFQDAAGSMNPRQRILDAISETVKLSGTAKTDAAKSEALRILGLVGLGADAAGKRPSALSGGQCQRASIARAIASRPSVLIADEPVSALDVSVAARILKLFRSLMEKRACGLESILMVSHDLAAVSAICDYAYVLEKGRIAEEGDPPLIFTKPSHPYTRRLLAAVPQLPRPGRQP